MELPEKSTIEEIYEFAKMLRNDNTRMIVDYLKSNGPANIKEIARANGKAYRTMQTAMYALLKGGMLEYKKQLDSELLQLWFSNKTEILCDTLTKYESDKILYSFKTK